MQQKLICTDCGTQVEFQREQIIKGGIECPNCSTTLPVFDEDTNVPGITPEECSQDVDQLRIPGYQILGVLGKGGMGVVLEGKQLSLGRRVAIKVLAPHLSSNPSFVERFEREATALAELTHPNIVTIFERGRSTKLIYFIMEYVEARIGDKPEDLRVLLSKGQLRTCQVKHYSEQIAEALSFAHDQGIVHRDIKPGNVMVDRHNNVKVADFGIASINTTKIKSQLTAPSAGMGTVDYMAPEQRENASAVDQRADIYSLGVLVYQMLTNQIPRGAYTSASKLRPATDPAWDTLIEKAMQPHPRDRLQSMSDFLVQLNAISVNGASDTTPSEERPDNTRKQQTDGCPKCEITVPSDTKFCPSCRELLWVTCTQCGTSIHASSAYCAECGNDASLLRKYQRYSTEATTHLSSAMNSDSSKDERLKSATQAGLIASRMLKLVPADPQAISIREKSNAEVVNLGCEIADTAYREKKLGLSLITLEQVIEVKRNHKFASKLHAKILEYKNRHLTAIDRHTTAGAPSKAIEILEKLVTRFPEDIVISAQLQECRLIHNNASSLVQDDIPRLAANNQWWSVRLALDNLKSDGVRVRGVDKYTDKVDARVAKIQPHLKNAKALIAQNRFVDAISHLDTALTIVSDHPEILELLTRVKAESDEIVGLMSQVQQACDSGKYFTAKTLSDRCLDISKSQKLSELSSRARLGCEGSNRYALILLWSILGATTMLIAFYLAELFTVGIENAAALSSAGLKGLITRNFFALSTLCGIYAIRKLVRRPFNTMRTLLLVFTWLVGINLSFYGGMQIKSSLDSAWILPAWDFLTYAFATSFVFSMAGRDLLTPETRKFPTLLTVGILAFGIVTLAEWANTTGTYTRFLLPSTWLFSCLLISGQSKSWFKTSTLLLTGLVASIIAMGIEKGDVQSPTWIQVLVAMAMLVTNVFLLQNKRSLKFITGITLTLACYFYLEEAALSYFADEFLLKSLTAWWMLAAYLAHESWALTKHQLLLRDRIAARRERAAI
jgi:serine/threonine protein kinase